MHSVAKPRVKLPSLCSSINNNLLPESHNDAHVYAKDGHSYLRTTRRTGDGPIRVLTATWNAIIDDYPSYEMQVSLQHRKVEPPSVAMPPVQTGREVLWSGTLRCDGSRFSWLCKKPDFVCDVARTKFRRLADVHTMYSSTKFARQHVLLLLAPGLSVLSGGASKLLEACADH